MNWQGAHGFGVLAVLLTGALLLASLDVGPVGPLVLVAPVPLLVYALNAPRTWHVGSAAFVARVIGALGMVYAYPQMPRGACSPGSPSRGYCSRWSCC